MSNFHRDAIAGDIHVIYQFSYANAAARLAAVMTATDIGKIARQTDNETYWILKDDSPLTWQQVGAGSGSGGINYVDNFDIESDASGYVTYADSAAAPVDGGGGSPTLTAVRSTSSPLRGSASLLVTPGALGNGVAYAFTISRADYARMIKVSFDYEIGTYASYTDGDVGIYIISASDSGFTTNLEVVQCAPYKVLKVSGQETFETVFQSHASNQYYRVCVHQVTSATGYTLKIDNVVVGPQSVAYGAPIGDWKAYTPTYTGFGTVSTSEVFYRRVGSNVEIKGKFLSGTSTGTEARVSLPSGMTSQDTSIIPTIIPCGLANRANGSNYVSLIEPSVSYITFGSNDAANPYTKLNGSQFGVASAYCSFHVFIPILGWSSNTEVSSDASTRVVAFRGYMSGSPTVADSTFSDVPFNNKEYDTHGAFNTSNYTYTVPVPGVYRINSWLSTIGGSWSGTEQHRIIVYKNGSAVRTFYQVPQSSWSFPFISIATDVSCVAGDTLKMVYRHTEGTTLSYNVSSSAENSFEITRVSGPAQIAASEKVCVAYSGSASSTVSAGNAVLFNTKKIDSHGAYNSATGLFTAPQAGNYRVGVSGLYQSSGGGSMDFYKNGSAYYSYFAGISSAAISSGTVIVPLVAGDTISIVHASGTTTMSTSGPTPILSIERL